MFSFGFLVKHSSCKSLISIVLKENLSKSNQLKKEEFNTFFQRIFPTNGVFLKPNDFDMHFSDYFDYYKNFNNINKFIFYDDERSAKKKFRK